MVSLGVLPGSTSSDASGVSADGAVPVHCKTYDGNMTDDQVHVETWSFLRELVGHADFLYVADSKLCNQRDMRLIARDKGRSCGMGRASFVSE